MRKISYSKDYFFSFAFLRRHGPVGILEMPVAPIVRVIDLVGNRPVGGVINNSDNITVIIGMNGGFLSQFVFPN